MPSFNDARSHLIGLISEKDHNSVITSCNDVFLFYVGAKSEDQIIGRTDYDLPWADYADIYRKHELDALIGNNYSTIIPIKDYQGKEHVFLHTKIQKLCNKKNIASLECYANKIIINTEVSELMQVLNEKFSVKKPCYYVGNYQTKIKFSKRQKEILFYLTRGKTARIIAQIIGISQRTVESYMENIKLKIGAFSKHEIINFAIMNGFSNILPEDQTIRKIVDSLKA